MVLNSSTLIKSFFLFPPSYIFSKSHQISSPREVCQNFSYFAFPISQLLPKKQELEASPATPECFLFFLPWLLVFKAYNIIFAFSSLVATGEIFAIFTNGGVLLL